MFGKLKEIIGLGEYDEEFDELDDAEEEEKKEKSIFFTSKEVSFIY